MSDDTSRRQYSSRHFGETKSSLVPDVPERLVHRAVERSSVEHDFSEERRHPVWVVDLPSRVISMTIGGLAPGRASRKHRHTYETILYVLEGEGRSEIEGVRVDWVAGDAVYIPMWAWHQHWNGSAVARCRYLACENAPMLQNLGVALREEET
jgi:quercetin dioxygenase-like cupin family protein